MKVKSGFGNSFTMYVQKGRNIQLGSEVEFGTTLE